MDTELSKELITIVRYKAQREVFISDRYEELQYELPIIGNKVNAKSVLEKTVEYLLSTVLKSKLNEPISPDIPDTKTINNWLIDCRKRFSFYLKDSDSEIYLDYFCLGQYNTVTDNIDRIYELHYNRIYTSRNHAIKLKDNRKKRKRRR